MSAYDIPTEASFILDAWRKAGDRIVFTNGVFDLIHAGHVQYLEEAKALGDRLVVGLNSDGSVARLKGPGRPLMLAVDRSRVLVGLRSVDLVLLFDEDTPLDLIEFVAPDVLVKGGDWPVDQIVGREFVEARGGKVLSLPLREGRSTSDLVERIRSGRSARE